MALIRDRKRASETWKWPELRDDGAAGELPAGDLVVPLAVWQARREELLARGGRLGLVLEPTDEPGDIAGDLAHFAMIAVRFPKFVDGRGYSTGRLLRERYGWQGELRAVGDIQRDQLFYLERCGFDSFALREGENVAIALAGFRDFSERYQAAVDQPVPLFKRREAA